MEEKIVIFNTTATTLMSAWMVKIKPEIPVENPDPWNDIVVLEFFLKPGDIVKTRAITHSTRICQSSL